MKKIQVNYDEAMELLETQFFEDLQKIEKKDLLREIKHLDHMGFALWMERMDWWVSTAAHISNVLFTAVQCGKLRFDEFAEALYEAAKMGYEDYWSLAGKLIHIMGEDGRQHHVYAPPTLMTLRKKLIEDEREDYWGVDWPGDDYPSDTTELLNTINRINKRFGVEK